VSKKSDAGAVGGRSEKGVKEKGAAACVQTRFPCLLIVVQYTNKDGTPNQRAMLYQDSLQANGAYSQVSRRINHRVSITWHTPIMIIKTNVDKIQGLVNSRICMKPG